MVIQKLKLHEWFLIYQLDHIKKTTNHIPGTAKLDITEFAKYYEAKNQKLPVNALLLKLLGVWAAANPEAHKMLFRNTFGLQFLYGDEIRINFPIAVKDGDRVITTAIVVRNPHLKTIQQLNSELKEAKLRPLSDYPVTQFVYNNSNTILFRSLLMGLHWIINHFPKFYWKKGGGCLSLSSLSNMSKKEAPFSAISFGPTGFTFFLKDLSYENSKTYLNLSIAIDHNCYSGIEMMSLMNSLLSMTQTKEQSFFTSITQDVHI